MAKILLKEKARALREKGFSIGEVAQKLNQPKSTVSYWCKNITLTKKQIQDIERRHKINSIAVLLTASEKQRKNRLQQEKAIAISAKENIGKISNRDLLMLGIGLYWGEGYKYEHSEFGFTNSDPKMITSYITWLNRVYGVEKKRCICRVSINNVHNHRLSEIEKYWQKVTGIPASQFSKSSIIKSVSKKTFSDTNSYFGTLRIKVRNGSELRHRVLSSIEAIKEQLAKG